MLLSYLFEQLKDMQRPSLLIPKIRQLPENIYELSLYSRIGLTAVMSFKLVTADLRKEETRKAKEKIPEITFPWEGILGW